VFDLEKMNELRFYSRKDPENAQGFRTILATESSHPYIKNWWPPGHIIGYEHAFTHGVVDFVDAVANGTPLAPNFRDGVKCVRVLEAALKSAASGTKQLI
jgi:predicted dehydrogenase